MKVRRVNASKILERICRMNRFALDRMLVALVAGAVILNVVNGESERWCVDH